MGKGVIYTCIGVGLSTLLVSTNWAMREPLNRGTGNKDRLHVFFIVFNSCDCCFSAEGAFADDYCF